MPEETATATDGVKSEHAEQESAVAAGRRNTRKAGTNLPGDPRRGLLTVRSTVILFAGLLIGGLVAGLLVLAGKHPAEAAVAGVLAVGGSIAGLHQLIE